MLFGSSHATVVRLPPRSVVSPTRLATRGVICAREGSGRLKKPGEQLSHPLRCPCFALPDYQDTPAFVLKAGAGGMITFDVTSQLRQPVVGIGGWLFATERTVMLMPEAAVHEDDLAQAWEDKVGGAG